MRRENDRLQAVGLDVVLIGLGTPEEAREFRASLKLPFTILSDNARTSYRRYDLLHISAARELNPGNLAAFVAAAARYGGAHSRDQDTSQLGGVFVVGTDGIIRFAFRAKHMSDRPTIEQLLAAAQKG